MRFRPFGVRGPMESAPTPSDERMDAIEQSITSIDEIQKAIPQATAKMLSQQLKELESDGIIRRKLYPVVPPKTEYSLTELGKTLVPIVNAMSDWGHDYFQYLGLPDPCPED